MKILWAFVMAVMPLMAHAQQVSPALAAQVARNPEKYLDDVVVMINGFGTNGAIDRAALQNVILLQRAEARAMALRRLQGADLNGDGAVSGDELRTKAATESAGAKGRFTLYFGKADANKDDLVSADELQAYAERVAVQIISYRRAKQILAIMEFDTNADASVTLEEVKAAIALTVSRKAKDDTSADRRI